MKWLHKADVDVRLIRYTELLAKLLDTTPVILSDYREGDKGQHGLGKAVDVYWPDLDPLEVLEYVMGLNIFGGIGIYLNEKGAVSFHFDIRSHKADGSIATWGCFITHPNGKKCMNYTTMDAVVKRIKETE